MLPAILLRAPRLESRQALWADGHKGRLPWLVNVIDEAAFVGFLPNRQTRTGSAPSLENFGVRA